MTDPYIALTIAMSSLAAIGIIALASLRGWRGWLELKRAELQQTRLESATPSAGSRIEVADLKERIRKLEAIAAGVDL
ncbi:hypothetical protein [Sphingobium boeckii]|uniref:Uncharacterized protein n=1 Tax=Sphingobium boeckii TaxID=1082345 RepID=A0A7W9EFE2_9SPHN|nr:hypothetical protein [Sphingobium boeckii]MBB5687167.1 hypothetical protein [Sphingobium boeckii]